MWLKSSERLLIGVNIFPSILSVIIDTSKSGSLAYFIFFSFKV